MMRRIRLLLQAVPLLGLVSPAQQIPPVDGRLYIPAAKAPVRLSRADLPSARALLPEPPQVVLPALDDQALRVANRRGQIPLGASRELAPGTVGGRWEPLPGGRRLWRITLHSPGAAALRVRFRQFHVASGRVWVYSERGEVEGPYGGGGPFGDGEFWSGTVSGDRITVEYEPGSEDAPLFDLTELAHLWDWPAAAGQPPRVAPCELDYKCYPQWADPGRAVAHIVYQGDADRNFYVCSGVLVNTRNSSLLPYFLTANHCIGSDSEARSLQAYWFYETTQCNGTPVTRSQATRIDGARLLSTGGGTLGDYSLVLLSSVPTGGVWFAGWEPNDPPLGTALTGIHHPDGSYKRISFGQRTTDRDAVVSGQLHPADKFLRVLYTEGRIEGGSSGSPVFMAGGRVAGVLSYGPITPPGQTACDIANFTAGYGRFSAMYPELRQFLEDTPPPASLTVTPRTLTFRASNGVVAAPAQQTLRLETQSAAAVAFTLEASPQWIRLSRTSGSASAAAAATVDVTIDAAAFATAGTYSGSITLRSGTALPQTVAVHVEVTTTRSSVVASAIPNPVYEQAPDPDGFSWFFDLRLEEKAGVETRLTQFRVDATDLSSRIQEFFGTDRVAAFGSINASLRTRGLTVPVDRVFEFGGTDAAGQAWSARVTARFLGRRTQATIAITITPDPVTQDPASENCGWRHDVTLTEQSGIGVELTRWVAGGHDLSADIAGWFQKKRLEPNGTLKTGVCWRGLRVPTTIDFEIGGRDDQGNDVRAFAQARFLGAPSRTSTLRVAPDRITMTAVAGRTESLTGVATVDPGSGMAWTARIAYSGTARNWLLAFPLSGVGSSTISMAAVSTLLATGTYDASLVVDAPGATPPQITIPILMIVGSQALPRPSFQGRAVVNAASFAAPLAPGMLFTIIGENLGTAEAFASRIPLATAMAGATVRVDGVFCPLLYVSPRQINGQLPYEIGASVATITVNVEGRESSQQVSVQALAPGVFTLDGVRPTPQPEGRRGDILIAYLTGVGNVTPAVVTGDAPSASTPVNSLPRPNAAVQVTVGGVAANVLFAGIPPGIVGAIQVNYQIPAEVQTGAQPLVFTVGGTRANAVSLNVLP